MPRLQLVVAILFLSRKLLHERYGQIRILNAPMKKIVKAARIGELGINLIQRIVLHDLGCMWYPPLRGTTLELEGDRFILYTKGSVPFFQTYPGMYVPRPLDVRVVSSEQTVRFLAHEILALTKLNWNTTQFDGGDPVTIQASRVVGQVLRFCGDDQIIAPRYGFYM
jgi:hypothetical protein